MSTHIIQKRDLIEMLKPFDDLDMIIVAPGETEREREEKLKDVFSDIKQSIKRLDFPERKDFDTGEQGDKDFSESIDDWKEKVFGAINNGLDGIAEPEIGAIDRCQKINGKIQILTV